MEILVIDVGGTTVKVWHTAHEERRKLASGKMLTPEAMIQEVRTTVADWKFEAVALGLSCRVNAGRIVDEPQNLAPGWIGYNFTAAFGTPVRIMNDACLQALGSYDGGRMVFLGLGTAVGSALIADGLILSLDVGRFQLQRSNVFELLGDAGFQRLGLKKWQKAVLELVPWLKSGFLADYIVLGGGNVKSLEELPEGVRRGHNRTVVEGGRKLWEELPDPSSMTNGTWIVR